MILLHPDLKDENIYGTDLGLLKNIIVFKKWFFREAFSRLTRVQNTKDLTWSIEAKNIDNLIARIKNQATWITYYGAFDNRSIPPSRGCTSLPGCVTGNQVISIFGGKLQKWRRPWLLSPSRHNIFCLAQMSTFGRALPPASKAVAQKEAKASFIELTTEPIYANHLDSVFKSVVRDITSRMARPNMGTHCSFSTSSCYEVTQEDGGMAAFLTDSVEQFLETEIPKELLWSTGIQEPDKVSMFGKVKGGFINDPIYDPFGRIAIPKGISKIFSARQTKGLRPLRFRDILYRDIDTESIPASSKKSFEFSQRFVKPCCIKKGNDKFCCPIDHTADMLCSTPINLEMVNQVRALSNVDVLPYAGVKYNQVLGDITSLWAFSDQLRFSEYHQNGEKVEPLCGLALFKEPGVKVYVQVKNIPCSYMVLEEPGWKARPLTKSIVSLTVIEQLCRHALEDSFLSDPRCGIGFNSGNILWDMLKFANKKHKGKVERPTFINSDLKSATNRIPKTLARAMWEGAFEGLGIDQEHPLYVYSRSQLKDFDILWKRKLTPHKCGSFMGTPLSFLGLTLYNLAVCELSISCKFQKIDPSKSEDMANYRHCTIENTSIDAIVGDDLLRVTDDHDLIKPTINVYTLTNAVISPGKFTISKHHGILCESHVFFEGGEKPYAFLDIIKARLLTDSCRFHADNRSSILGKGSSLNNQVMYYSETNKDYGNVPSTVITMYERILKSIISEWLFKKMVNSGIHLPHSCGGLQFPMPWDEINIRYKDKLNILSSLLKKDFTTCMQWIIRLRSVHGQYRRGLEVPDYSKIYRDFINLNLPVGNVFDPTVKDKIYPLSSALKYIITERTDIPVSAYTGLPQIKVSLKALYDSYGFISVDTLLDQWDRYFCFLKAFTSKPKPVHYSFHNYVKNLNRFWSDLSEEVTPEEDHTFKDFNHLSWSVALKSKTLIHVDFCKEKILCAGPTLHVMLRQPKLKGFTEGGVNPPKHTQMQWDEFIRNHVSNYLRSIGADDDTITPQVQYLQSEIGIVWIDGKWVFENKT